MRRLHGACAIWLAVALLGGCQWENEKDNGLPLRYRSDDFKGQAFVFLVAGSRESANFAQEIVDQAEVFQAKGVPRAAIACYYVRPNRAQFLEDEAQWTSLARRLSRCYEATPALLQRHLAASARQSHPFVYFYFSGHGLGPVGRELWAAENFESRWKFFRLAINYPILHHYHLVLEGDSLGSFDERLAQYAAGASPRDLFLTPDSLGEMLASFPRDAQKIAVLQACFSGGFVKAGDFAGRLSAVPGLTVISSARHDRQSFGVEPGEHMTFFGSAFNLSLRENLAKPPENTNWPDVFQGAKSRVETTEVLRFGSATPLSLPVFFHNAP